MRLNLSQWLAVFFLIAGAMVVLGLSILFTGGAHSLRLFAETLAWFAALIVVSVPGALWLRRRRQALLDAAWEEGEEEAIEEIDFDDSPTVIPVRQNGALLYVPNERTPPNGAPNGGGGGVSERDRQMIRRLHREEGLSMAAIARLFDISKSTVHAIVHEASRDV